MSSTNKTSNLKLNQWIGSDKPERIDFNYDNSVVDKAITQHKNDANVHIKESEREKWNSPVFYGRYYGDGSVNRIIETQCPFPATFGMVFAQNRTPTITNFSSSKINNYFAIFGYYASTQGAALSANRTSIIVEQSPQAILANEYANLNEAGVAYHYIMFR